MPDAVSIVVPTLNEPGLEAWLGALQTHMRLHRAEIIVVDDSEPVARYEMATVIAGPQRGKGAAVREGILAARGDAIVVVDADLDDAAMKRIPEFVARIREGHDIVLGERTRWRFDNLARFVLSLGLFLAQRLVIFQSARFFDTQCGLKAFSHDAGRRLATLQRVDGGMYDIEYLYIGVRRKMRITSIPVATWPELRPSRIEVMRCIRTDPLDLLRVKWNGLRGWYTQ